MFESRRGSFSNNNNNQNALGRMLNADELTSILENPFISVRYVRSRITEDHEKIYFLEDARQFWNQTDEDRAINLQESISVYEGKISEYQPKFNELDRKYRNETEDKNFITIKSRLDDAKNNLGVIRDELAKLGDKKVRFTELISKMPEGSAVANYFPNELIYLRLTADGIIGYAVNQDEYAQMLEEKLNGVDYHWYECRSILHYLTPVS